jgi:hypothetical protein
MLLKPSGFVFYFGSSIIFTQGLACAMSKMALPALAMNDKLLVIFGYLFSKKCYLLLKIKNASMPLIFLAAHCNSN